MYGAINQDGEFIYAENASAAQYFICPNCFNKVILIKSKRGHCYFRHLKRCGKTENHYLESHNKNKGESREHKQAKALLLENFRRFGYKCKQEVVFNQIGQIADIMVKDVSGEWIIEYQKSIISPYELEKRQNNYRALGYRVQWIIDDDYLKLKDISKWVRRCLTYSDKLKYHVWTLNLEEGQSKCYYGLPLVYRLDNLKLKVTNFPPKSNWILAYKERLKLNTEINYIASQKLKSSQESLKDYLMHSQSIKNNPIYRSYLRQVYNYHVDLNTIPIWVFKYNWRMLAFEEPGWLIWIWAFESMRWLNKKSSLHPTEDSFNFSTFSSRMSEHLEKKHFRMLKFPLLIDDKKLSEQTFYILYDILKRLKQDRNKVTN